MHLNKWVRRATLALTIAGALIVVGCKSGSPVIVNPGQSGGGGGEGGASAALCARDTGEKINRKAAMQTACQHLSGYQLFEDSDNPLSKPNGNGMPYVVTTLLFSNYASKARVMYIPPGKKATYHKDQPFTFPVGTIIAKTFYFHTDLRDETSKPKLIETRLIIHRKDGWIGLPYVWNANKTDAALMKYGARVEPSVTGLNGETRSIPYDVPTQDQCAKCHKGHSGENNYSPIGPKARYLNYKYTYPDGKTENQLVHMTKLGLLKGAPANPAKNAPRAPRAFDVFKPASKVDFSKKSKPWVDSHARAYLDANCGYCHRKNGLAGYTGVYFLDNARNHEKLDINWYGLCHKPTSAGRGQGKLLYDIVAGKPDKSIVMYRIDNGYGTLKNPTGVLMPPISRSVIDKVGVKLVRQWIKNLPKPHTCQAGGGFN